MNELIKQEMDVIRACVRMKRNGISVDLTRLFEIKKRIEDLLINNVSQIASAVTVPYKAGRIWMQAYFNQNGIRVNTNPKTGLPIFDYEALEKVDDPVIRLILRQRDLEKSLTTIVGYLNNSVFMGDGHKIFPMINTHGASTGRFSYSSPNLQNIPKDDEFAVRSVVIPDKGKYLVSIDYSAQEYRVFADYASDTRLIDRLNNGEDIHQMVADMLNIERKQAKTVLFAILYGSGNSKLAAMLSLPVHKAVDLRNKLYHMIPAMRTLTERVVRVAESRGYVRNSFGRRLYTPSRSGYMMLNHLVQSTCADTMKKAMVEIDRFFNGEFKMKSKMLATIHDELLFEIDYSEEGIENECKKIMEEVYPARAGIKLPCELKRYTNSWGE